MTISIKFHDGKDMFIELLEVERRSEITISTPPNVILSTSSKPHPEEASGNITVITFTSNGADKI